MAIDTIVEKALREQPAASYYQNSGLRHRVSAATKWRNGQESVKTALKGIQDALYSLPGYMEAEETNDRDEQVGIINKFITQTPLLTDYFFSHGLRDLMRNFIDKTGHAGLKKEQSPKALLDFYSAQKGLNWFDRTQQSYVQGWRIQENGMWQRGEQSVQLALEAMQDALRSLPGFRQAEDTGDRDEQVRIINQFITQAALADFFAKAGLSGLMQRFVDPEGRVGIRKRQSPKTVLEFYSENKGLGWFDRALPTHVEAWRMKEQRMWKSGEKSAQLAAEAIEDVLYTLPGYREAERAGNREEQLRTLNQVLQKRGRQRDYFERVGLNGLMSTLVDRTGRTGPKKLGSLSALLEFYSERKGLDWFSPAYAMHLAANKSGRLAVVDRRQEWSDGQYGSKKSYEGTGLERIVNKTLANYGLQEGVAEFCYMFFSKKDALLTNSLNARVILAYKLQVFLYMAGVIPRILPDGEVRRLGPKIQDLAFMGYSYFTHVDEKASLESVMVDKLFNRLMMNIVRQNTRDIEKEKETGSRDNDPSVEELIDEIGAHPLIVQRYGRAVSYDDVLTLEVVMERYMTGQRQVIIRIGEKSVPMTPESVDDYWVLNPEFIKLRHDERLYIFWQRAKKKWPRLVNLAGQHKRVRAYSGETATYEAIESNPKAKLIKLGPLPSSELAKLGVLTAMARREGKSEAAEETTGKGETGTDYKPAYVSLEEFRGYEPSEQLAETSFKLKLRQEIRQKGAPNMARVMQLAKEVGLIATPGKSGEVKVRKIISGEEYVIMAKRGTDPKNPDEYVSLKKFQGENGERIKKFFYGPLERAVQNVHPNYSIRAVHQATGGTITVLEENGIETRGDLEDLLQNGWSVIQAVKGLVNIEKGNRERLTSFVLASQELGYQVPAEAIAATQLKYRGKDSKPIKDAARGYFEQAVRNEHPDWNEIAVRRAAGITISTFESNNILFMSQLEELAQRVAKEGESALQTVKGLVNQDPRKRVQLNYTLRTFELAGLYQKPQPAGQAVIVAPSERAASR